MAFNCGNCKGKHDLAIEGQACYAGSLVSCGWLVLRTYYDFDDAAQQHEEECGAPAIETERGFSCASGHSHVNAEYRDREGWDYADGPGEAYVLAYFGTVPVRMDGSGISETRRPTHFAY